MFYEWIICSQLCSIYMQCNLPVLCVWFDEFWQKHTIVQPPLYSCLVCLNFNSVASNMYSLNNTILRGRRKLEVIQGLMGSLWLIGRTYMVIHEERYHWAEFWVLLHFNMNLVGASFSFLVLWMIGLGEKPVLASIIKYRFRSTNF